MTSLPLDGRPHGVAVTPSGVFYVSRIDDDSATRGALTGDGQSLRGSAPTGSTPAHVALHPEGGTAYTANQFGNSVSVINVANNTLSATIPLSDGGFNLITSPDGAQLYVTTAAGVLHTIATGERRVTATRSVGEAANGLAFNARTHTLYVSSIFGATVTAINATQNEVIRTYPVSWGPQRLALAANGAELYIASQTTGLEVLNLATGVVEAVPGLDPGGVGLALSPDDAQLYMTNPPAGKVIVVDRASRAIVRTLTFCSPRNVAFGRWGRVAIVTDECGFVHFVR